MAHPGLPAELWDKICHELWLETHPTCFRSSKESWASLKAIRMTNKMLATSAGTYLFQELTIRPRTNKGTGLIRRIISPEHMIDLIQELEQPHFVSGQPSPGRGFVYTDDILPPEASELFQLLAKVPTLRVLNLSQGPGISAIDMLLQKKLLTDPSIVPKMQSLSLNFAPSVASDPLFKTKLKALHTLKVSVDDEWNGTITNMEKTFAAAENIQTLSIIGGGYDWPHWNLGVKTSLNILTLHLDHCKFHESDLISLIDRNLGLLHVSLIDIRLLSGVWECVFVAISKATKLHSAKIEYLEYVLNHQFHSERSLVEVQGDEEWAELISLHWCDYHALGNLQRLLQERKLVTGQGEHGSSCITLLPLADVKADPSKLGDVTSPDEGDDSGWETDSSESFDEGSALHELVSMLAFGAGGGII